MKILLITIVMIFTAVVVAAAGWFFYRRGQLKPLDDEARRQAPGQFISLLHGLVHYQLHGEGDDKPLIVFVHGFSTPSFVWNGLLPPLLAAGFRVLTYDLYGRGWSARPDVRYDARLYEEQLVELLAALHLEGKMSFVGYSMGGAIVTHFAARYWERVSNLVLIAPAGLVVNWGSSRGAALFPLPVLGDWLMVVRGRQFMLDVMQQPENQGKAVPDIVARYQQQMDYAGYLPAILSTLRHFPMAAMQNEYAVVGKQDFPVLAVWGARDNVVPVTNVERIKTLVPRAHFAILDHAHHAITYSEPEFVSQAIIEFLRTPIGKSTGGTK